MKNKIAIFCLILLNILKAEIDFNVAQQLSQEIIKSKKSLNSASLIKEKCFIKTENDIPIYYVFNYSHPSFVVVSALDDENPILGFSFTNNLEINDLPPALNNILEKYTQNFEIQKKNSYAKSNNQRSNKIKSQEQIGPFLTTQWNQSYPYNAYCPKNFAAGCVATAMAQIMKYYNYPQHGFGEHHYITRTHKMEMGCSFVEDYNWDDMPNTLSSTAYEQEYKDIATLLLHIGIAVDMNYSWTSGASPKDVAISLKKHFAYSETTDLRRFWDYDVAENDSIWESKIRNEILQNRPIFYSTEEDERKNSGHAYVIDGLLDDYYHINWGWGGTSDGYFLYGGFLSYNNHASMVIGIEPKPLHIYFKADTLHGLTPLTVNFTHQSISRFSNIESIQWNFGDGTISTEQSPSNIYLKEGSYDVSLIVNTPTISDTLVMPNYICCTSPRTLTYVSPSGSDETGLGTAESPFATIQHAIFVSNDGDTVLVENGEYNETINFSGRNILVSSRYLFSGNWFDVENTIINAEQRGSVATFENGEDSTCTLDGFTLTNGLGTPIVHTWVYGEIYRHSGGGILCRNSSSPSLQNLIICNNTASFGEAIYSENNSNFKLLNSHIYQNGTTGNSHDLDWGHGGILFFHTSNNTLENCIISDNYNEQQYDLVFASKSTTNIKNSIISFPDFGYDGCIKFNWCTVHFENCTLWGNNKKYMQNHVGDVTFENSIVWNFPQPAFNFSGTCGWAYLTANYSALQHGANFYNIIDGSTVTWGEGNIDQNPQFQDADNCNFNFLPTSPCINAANPTNPEHPNIGADLNFNFNSYLPVELASFSAQPENSYIRLVWETLSEKNNLGFEIQRKNLKGEFEKIGFKPGQGTRSSKTNYEFIDYTNFQQNSVTYRLKQIDTNGKCKYSDELKVSISASKWHLSDNYPNPFNNSTQIQFELANDEHVALRIYNMNGQLLKTLVDKHYEKGVHRIVWNGTNELNQSVASGLYIYELRSKEYCKVKTMLLIK